MRTMIAILIIFLVAFLFWFVGLSVKGMKENMKEIEAKKALLEKLRKRNKG